MFMLLTVIILLFTARLFSSCFNSSFHILVTTKNYASCRQICPAPSVVYWFYHFAVVLVACAFAHLVFFFLRYVLIFSS